MPLWATSGLERLKAANHVRWYCAPNPILSPILSYPIRRRSNLNKVGSSYFRTKRWHRVKSWHRHWHAPFTLWTWIHSWAATILLQGKLLLPSCDRCDLSLDCVLLFGNHILGYGKSRLSSGWLPRAGGKCHGVHCSCISMGLNILCLTIRPTMVNLSYPILFYVLLG